MLSLIKSLILVYLFAFVLGTAFKTILLGLCLAFFRETGPKSFWSLIYVPADNFSVLKCYDCVFDRLIQVLAPLSWLVC